MNNKPFELPIYVTRPFLPPLDEFKDGLQEIWDNQWLTNDGPVLQRYQKELCKYFQTENISVFSNGTLALQLALQALEIKGEVITTPFTFVATTHALFWNNLTPVFSDIEPDTFNLDPSKIEEKITKNTKAILAVHVFGNPCNLKELERIANKYNLYLIYDAAHAFGVEVNGTPISQFGDISMFSFHATKLYHSFEGGMLSFKDDRLKKKLAYLKNFGFENELEVIMPGTNAKMNEIQALMGSILLKYIDKIIIRRKQITDIYKNRLSEIKGISTVTQTQDIKYNYAYLPVLIDEEKFGVSRDNLYDSLKEYNVFARKYFYPLIPEYACYKHLRVKDPLVVARRVSEQVLTLPIYEDLSNEDVEKICEIIKGLRK